MEANGHHLILGDLVDFITGRTIPDTLDERYRQRLAHLLVETCGFDKGEIEKSLKLRVAAGEKQAEIKVDFLVSVGGRAGMLIRFAPGSLVTRRRSMVALSRIVKPFQVPVTVVTNGEDAEILDGKSGMILGTGLGSLPSREELSNIIDSSDFKPLSSKQKEMASRIVYAFEVDGSCPCDTDICRL